MAELPFYQFTQVAHAVES